MKLQRIKSKCQGRYLVKCPEGFPGKRYGGLYTYEHIAVYWVHNNALPPPGWHIHHINGDPTDNRIENLEAISATEHAKNKHYGGKKIAEQELLVCVFCLNLFYQLKRTVNYRKNQGQIKFYCSKSCQAKHINPNRKGKRLNYPKNRKVTKVDNK